MSANTSATGGYLDIAPSPGRIAVEDLLHDAIVGITGLDGTLVRPRWQPDPPKQPALDVNWCAFGIVGIDNDGVQVIHNDDVSYVHAERLLTVLVSFYGPGADDLAERLANGLHVAQNREQMIAHSLAFVSVGSIVPVPELIGTKWLRRVDLQIVIRKGTPREAGRVRVLNLQSAPVIITAESGLTVTGETER
jgi:hypothetical protein